jgi:glycosyltransferase involved in cell wall biosynthesis
MPTVTVVVPTFNRPRMLAQALASIRSQTYGDWECIVVDDGSDPPARPVVDGLGDPRIQYVWRANAGRSAARNAGIALARREYVAFLDDDDLWLPNKLALQVPVLSGQPEVGLVTAGWRYVDAAGEPLREMTPWVWRPQLGVDSWLFSCPALPSGVLVRREWLDRAGGFDESLDANEDRDLWLRLAYLGCPMVWVQEVVCDYRLHESNTVRKAVNQKRTSIAMLTKFFARPDLPVELAAKRDEVYAWVYLQGAAGEYGVGQVGEAKADVETAVKLNPSLLANDCQGMWGALVARAVDPVMGDPLSYLATMFDNLPAEAAGLARSRRGATVWAVRYWLFGAHARLDSATARRYLAQLIALDPRTLTERRVLAALGRSLLGGSVRAQDGPDARQARARG